MITWLINHIINTNTYSIKYDHIYYVLQFSLHFTIAQFQKEILININIKLLNILILIIYKDKKPYKTRLKRPFSVDLDFSFFYSYS
jgi:hypothetical protein